MIINDKMKVRTVVGENIVMMQGEGHTDMTRVVALNTSAMELYNALLGKEFELADVVKILTDNYDVDEEVAKRDAEAWLADMKKNNLVL
ncbi:MAG: PqqD family protein [Bacteroidales bacterium]|nr:PqqD family protein [Bacteroidales bacterium]